MEENESAGTPTVLFDCVHNAGRSQMAAAWLEQPAGGRVRVLSGGSAPAAGVNPAAVAVMAEAGIDIAGRGSRTAGPTPASARPTWW